ncbi:MAG: RNA polymerase sigma factor [Wenzhouxiangellaceae bacterium]
MLKESTIFAESCAAETESLDDFLASVQGRALAMARLACSNAEQALDLVQDAMCAFVAAYRDKPADQRRALFFRCLHHRIIDWHRKCKRRNRWWFFPRAVDEEQGPGDDPLRFAIDEHTPEQDCVDQDFAARLERALRALPLRQRQVFLLRAWEGLDVAETARALGISAGSVKTHYFRALSQLRSALEEHHD